MKKPFILTIIIGTMLTVQSHAQRSAQAVIQVTATVVKANKVEMPSSVQVHLSERRKNDRSSELGNFSITGLENSEAFMEFPDKVILLNEEGEELRLLIQTAERLLNGESLYKLIATPPTEVFLAGNYRGNYKATVVYN